MPSAAKGKVDRLKGSVKAGAGRATKNRSLERKGRNQKVKGNAKDAAKKAKNALTE